MKLKVGDKVRIRKDLEESKKYYATHNFNIFNNVVYEMTKYKGKIATIQKITNGQYKIDIDGGEWLWIDTMFEGYMVFTKSDLKNGMVVEFNNGDRKIVLRDVFSGFDGFMQMADYTETLECKKDNEFTIYKVYHSSANTLNYYFQDYKLTLIWERPKEEPHKEMTIEEIEKELGYKIKIVADDKN